MDNRLRGNGQNVTFQEVRCVSCKRLLLRANIRDGHIEIKCAHCYSMTQFAQRDRLNR